MLRMLEKLFVYGLTDGHTIGVWDLETLADKLFGRNPSQYTFAEKHALMFFEEMGGYMGEREKWKRPYGSVLNEKRELH